MKKQLAIFGIAIVTVSFMSFSLVSASHSWSKYHWNLSTADTEANPLKIGDNLTSAAWKNSLSLASDDWNESVLKNQVVPGTSNANCDPTLGRIEVCNGSYGDNGWLGIAQVWAYRGKDGHIAQAVAKYNDTYFNLPAYSTSAWRNLVMCQEVGHGFGLGHQDENFTNANLGSCMDYTNDPDGTIAGQLNNEHPNQHDYDMLASIYDHLNGTSDNNGPGNGGNGKGRNKANVPSQALNNPSEWGKAIAQDARGKNSLYQRDLGNGLVVITHVTWAE